MADGTDFIDPVIPRGAALHLVSCLFVAFFSVQSAKACALPGENKFADELMNEQYNLDEIITFRLSSGIELNVPLGYLGGRLGSHKGIVYDAEWFGYYFCFPSGEYAPQDMLSYFPTAVREFDPERIPIEVSHLRQFQLDSVDEVDSLKRRTFNILNNAKTGFPGQTIKIDHIFGLTRILQSTPTGDIKDSVAYVAESDPVYNVTVRDFEHLVQVRTFNRHTGVAIIYAGHSSVMSKWREITQMIEKQFVEWQK